MDLSDISAVHFNSVKWSYDGSRLATTSKDGCVRLWDPRTPADQAVTLDGLPAKKVNKAFWCGNLPFFGTLGSDKSSKRKLVIWDVNNIEAGPVENKMPDSSSSTSSVALPHYDPDVNILYYFGKGESQVWFGEIMQDGKVVAAGRQNLQKPQKGGCWVPKHGLDAMKCEVQRFMKIEAKAVIPHSFIFPKKNTDVFHQDVYPDTFQGMPALTSEEWFGGANAAPLVGSMNPENRSQGDGAGFVFEKKATYAELEAENRALKERVAELEAQLA